MVTLTIGAVISYRTRSFEWTTFHLSSLQDDFTNPDGYLIPLFGTLIAQLLLVVPVYRLGRGLVQRGHASALFAGSLIVLAMTLLSINNIHELMKIANWHIHAILAHVAFGLMIAGHWGLLHAAAAHVNTSRDLHADKRLVAFSFAVVVILFLIPKFTGTDVTMKLFGFPVDVILGACEVIYVSIFYVSLWRIARSLEPTHR